MNALSIILLVLIAAWFVYALIRTVRTKGCGCGGCTGDCEHCGCPSCKKKKS
ncbi:MAG: hypothetical protein Q4D43_10460 [Clostridia bacterium]|nr:hypothetical protein [Clostridia bacterium]